MAHKNLGIDEILVCDRFARGYPEHPVCDKPCAVGPLTEALTEAFEWDAHVVAYCPPLPRRLAGAGALDLKPEMRFFIVDVDGPNHAATDEWWATEVPKITAATDKRPAYVYRTKGGYRIIWGLQETLALATPRDALRWRLSYLEWIRQLREQYGISGDEKCADWARLFRLPKVRRDGVDVVPASTLGYPDRIGAWREPYLAADDPRLTQADVSAAPVIPADYRAVPDDKLQEAADALLKAWPKRGRHYAGLALCGALARAGWPEGAIVDFVCGGIMRHTADNGDPEVGKWTRQATDVHNKLARGENVTGWPALEECLCAGLDGLVDESRREGARAAIGACTKSLGMISASELFKDAREYANAIRAELARQRANNDALALAVPEDDAEFMKYLDEAAEVLGPVFTSTQADPKKKLERDIKQAKRMFMSGRQLKAMDIPAPRYLVEYLLVEGGVSALAGEPKSGKSWDATHMALCVASGSLVYGKFKVPEACGVAYFYAEDPAASVKIRTNAIAAGLGLDADGDWLDRWYPQPRGRQIDARSLFDMCLVVASVWAAEAEAGTKIRLLVLDPLSDIHSGDENDRNSMAPIMHTFRGVAGAMSKRAGCEVGILFVHHSTKVSADKKSRKRGGQNMRGSSALHGAVDNGLYLDNLRTDDTSKTARIESEVKSAKDAGMFDRKITIEDDAFGHAVKVTFGWSEPEMEESEVKNKKETQERLEEQAFLITKRLWNHGAHLTQTELHRKIGGNKPNFNRAVEAALEFGWIAYHMQGGRNLGVEVTEAGRAVAASRGGRGDGGGEDPEPDKPSGAPPGSSDLAKMLASMVPGTQ